MNVNNFSLINLDYQSVPTQVVHDQIRGILNQKGFQARFNSVTVATTGSGDTKKIIATVDFGSWEKLKIFFAAWDAGAESTQETDDADKRKKRDEGKLRMEAKVLEHVPIDFFWTSGATADINRGMENLYMQGRSLILTIPANAANRRLECAFKNGLFDAKGIYKIARKNRLCGLLEKVELLFRKIVIIQEVFGCWKDNKKYSSLYLGAYAVVDRTGDDLTALKNNPQKKMYHIALIQLIKEKGLEKELLSAIDSLEDRELISYQEAIKERIRPRAREVGRKYQVLFDSTTPVLKTRYSLLCTVFNQNNNPEAVDMDFDQLDIALERVRYPLQKEYIKLVVDLKTQIDAEKNLKAKEDLDKIIQAMKECFEEMGVPVQSLDDAEVGL